MRPLRSRRSAAAAELGSLPSRSDRRSYALARAPLSRALLASALLAPIAADVPDATAENLRIIPSLTVRETYSNNINLAPSGFERSDLVSELSPTLSISESGARTRLNGNISLPILLYARSSGENSVQPAADVTGSYEVIPRFFFVEGQANVSQQYVSPFGPRPATNENITQNRYTGQSYRVTPYIRGNAAGDLTYELRDDNSWTKLGSNPLVTGSSTAYTNQLNAKLARSPAPLGWSTDYTRSAVKFASQDPLVSQIGRVNFIDRVDPQLEVYASGGYESNDYTDAQYSGITYGVGATWHPTARTTAKANWEHRFFGSAYVVDLEHRRPLSVWSFQASRDITTYPQQFASLAGGQETAPLVNQLFLSSIADPVERQRAVEQFIRERGLPANLLGPVNLFSNQVYLQETAQGSVALRGVRNSVVLTLYRSRSRAIVTGGFEGLTGVPQSVTQMGTDVSWTHNLSPSLVFGANADYSRSTGQFADGGHANQGTLGATLSSPLTQKTTLSGGVRYQVLRSDVTTGYKEFAVYAALTHAFR